MIQRIEFDKAADAVYVYFSDKPVAYTKKLDDMRYIDYASDNTLIGIELLCVSSGVSVDDLPHAKEVERILQGKRIKILV